VLKSYPTGNPTMSRIALALAAFAIFAAGTVDAAERSDNPLSVIRFDRPNVNYESGLYGLVRSAQERDPRAQFEVIAAWPYENTPGAQALAASNARRNAETVVRSLTSMGVPSQRIRVSTTGDRGIRYGEVRVYVR
jgi:hypothetical protein